MVSKKYRGSCIGAALAKWLTKNTVASQKMALKEKIEDGALEMLLEPKFWFYYLSSPRTVVVPHYPIIDIDIGNTDDFINIRQTKNCHGPIIDIDIGNTHDFLNIILNNI